MSIISIDTVYIVSDWGKCQCITEQEFDKTSSVSLMLAVLTDGSVEAQQQHPSPKRSWTDRLWERILCMFYGILDDFTDLPAQEPQGDPEGDPLTVKRSVTFVVCGVIVGMSAFLASATCHLHTVGPWTHDTVGPWTHDS